ncbi:DUF748 domain-containing protein [Marinicella meishanensis]|uniref:DUF748 domain-containing protein n=1 Tax=Marinicella meishanensis TaxID=2873263 RepID=UPI001CC07C4F|nr:DUF748 domain-containing protein [Marinicella sp. NBU2979]
MNKKWYRYKRLWLLLLIATYLLLGFFYVPRVIQQELQTQLQTELEQQVTVQQVSFNPLTFITRLEGLSVTDAQQQTWFQATALEVNFDPLNLLWGQWRLADLNLVQPVVSVQTDPSGRLLMPVLPAMPATDEPQTVTDLVIDDIDISGGQMALMVGQIRHDFALNIKHLTLNHEKFIIADEDTAFDLSITTELDETVTLKGHYNHRQQRIETDFQLKQWQATTVNRFLPESLAFSNQAGLIQAQGRLDWPLTTSPLIELSTVSVTGWQGQWQQHIMISDLATTLTEVRIDTHQSRITVAQVQATDGAWQVHWPLPAAADSPPTVADDSGDAWQIQVDQVRIEQWPVTFNDETTAGTLAFTLREWSGSQLNNNGDPVSLDGSIDFPAGGSLTVTSEQHWQPWQMDTELNLAALNLAQFNAWVTDQTGLVITQGSLSSQHQWRMAEQQFTATGELSIQDLQLDNRAQQNIASVGRLSVGASQLSSAERTIVVDQITLDQASGNLIIDADQQLNIQHLTDDQAAPTTDESGPEKPQDAAPWVIQVGRIEIIDASTALLDQSIEPNVTTRLSELSGEIKGLSSESLSKADVQISGKFNQFSPVTIEGQINPLSSAAYTDITVAIEDLDLLAFSPYADTFLAFPIIGGKLDVALDYQLNQQELRGENRLLFKQFKLGERNQSPNAINLPLKLAVSLLTDMNGEMTIDLPVSGNLNDPEFSYGGLIGKALFKLITNIVASPFKILGALIPNPDPNLSDIQFSAGGAELLPSEQNKLNQIATIMGQKPGLNLQLNPQIGADFDRAALQTQQLLQQAPFEALDWTHPDTLSWLEAQIPVAQQVDFTGESGLDHRAIWQHLVAQQNLTEAALENLIQQRNLSIKNHLIEQAGIAAERIFIEQTQFTDSQQAMIKIGVSQ